MTGRSAASILVSVLSFETLACCAECGCHARVSEPVCPHCGAAMRRADGTFRRTAAAAVMGLSAAVLTAVPLACGTETDTETDDAGGASGGGKGGAGGGGSTDYTSVTSYGNQAVSTYGVGSTGSPAYPGPTSSGGSSACAAQPPASCEACCADAQPVGAEVAEQAVVDACLCSARAPCHDMCEADVCKGGAASAACFTCLTGLPADASCLDVAETACLADPDCSALLACKSGC